MIFLPDFIWIKEEQEEGEQAYEEFMYGDPDMLYPVLDLS